ncbi:MAG: ribonuclease III [Hydrogenophilus sp.]|nr:ribonuclease III [Hydrogenophilus sp.]
MRRSGGWSIDHLGEVEAVLGYRFRRPGLVRQALTHRSAGEAHYERLEFLGDALLGLVAALMVWERFPEASEGDLTRARARLVRRETLTAMAQRLGLERVVVVGESVQERERGHPSILADAVEALLGAVLVDGGMVEAERLARAWLAEPLASINDLQALKDPKTQLQEWLQGEGLPVPEYRLRAVEGPPHAQQFRAVVAVPPLGLEAEGVGTTRRGAEQAAAAALLRILIPSEGKTGERRENGGT